MDYKEFLLKIELDLNFEIYKLHSILKDPKKLVNIKRIISNNYSDFAHGLGTHSFQELLNDIEDLKIDYPTKYALMSQAIFNLFEFGFSIFENIYNNHYLLCSNIDNEEIKIIRKSINFNLSRLGYEIKQYNHGSNREFKVQEINSFSKIVAFSIPNDELALFILKFNFIDSDIQTKKSILLEVLKYIENKQIKLKLNNSTTGIRSTYQSLNQILQNIKHNEDHSVHYDFVSDDINKWINNAYKLSLEVLMHIINGPILDDFDKLKEIELQKKMS